MRQLTKIFLTISLVFSLSACGYGSEAETAKMGPVGNGIDTKIGEMRVQEILVINDGTNAVLTAVLINTGDEAETLVGASVDNRLVKFVDTASGVATEVGDVTISARSSVSLSFTAPLGAIVTNDTLPTAGSIVKVLFSFANNGFVKSEALVFANEDIYSTITPSAFALSN